MGIERMLANVAGLGPAVRNNAGGYYNHNIYWTSMSPNGGGDPSGALGAAVERDRRRGCIAQGNDGGGHRAFWFRFCVADSAGQKVKGGIHAESGQPVNEKGCR